MDKKKQILIIDDDPDITETLRLILEKGDYQVAAASSGKEGIDKARDINPSLIILDVMMERTDEGFEVCRVIKGDSSLSRIPILILTSLQEKTGFDFKPEAGDRDWLPADDYVDKPIDPDELLKKARGLIKE